MIDYSVIANAIQFYQSRGFRYTDVPWLVGVEAIYSTMPVGGSALFLSGHEDFVVASAEQSFIQMMRDGTLKPGKYCACTPCYRQEPKYDDLSRPYFMKVELIDYMGGTTDDDVSNMTSVASEFLRQHVETMVAKTSLDMNCYDRDIISVVDAIELGSYGVRRYGDHHWVYGTGVAEPRLSEAKYREMMNKVNTTLGELHEMSKVYVTKTR